MRNRTLLLMTLLTGILLFSSIVQAQEDVGVSAIISPPDTVVLDSSYPLKAVVFNLGNQPSSFDVVFTIELTGSGSFDVADTVSITNLPNGIIDTVEFSATFIPASEGTYDVIAYTVLAGDENPDNDTASKEIMTHWGLAIWYGNISGEPIATNINERISIEVYAQTNADVYVADCHLCLGFNLTYVDSLLSTTEGSREYPLDQWDFSAFLDPDFGEPAMPDGFASHSFQGFSNISPPYNSPYLNSQIPIHLITFVAKTANDSSIIGATANALVKGNNRIQGPSNAGDSTATVGFPVLEHFTPYFFRGAGKVRGTDRDCREKGFPEYKCRHKQYVLFVRS